MKYDYNIVARYVLRSFHYECNDTPDGVVYRIIFTGLKVNSAKVDYDAICNPSFTLEDARLPSLLYKVLEMHLQKSGQDELP